MNEKLVAIKATIVAAWTALGALLGWRGVMLIGWVVAMALDYITGSLAACKAGEWSSATAREGLWHKGGMITVVMVSALADGVMAVVANYLPLEISWPGLVLPLVTTWYILTELGSILENAVKMGAPVPAWLVNILKAGKDAMDKAGENAIGKEA